MTRHKRFFLLFLFPLTICLGCGESSEMNKTVEEYLKLDRELCDAVLAIHDKASLDASSADILSKCRTLCELQRKLKTLRGPKEQVERLIAKVNAQQRELGPRVEAGFRGLMLHPGGKEFCRSVMQILGEGGCLPGYNPQMLAMFDGETVAEQMHRQSQERLEEMQRQQREAMERLRNNNNSGSHFGSDTSGSVLDRPRLPVIDLASKEPGELVEFFDYHDSSIAMDAIRRAKEADPESASNDVKRSVAKGLQKIAEDRMKDSRTRCMAMEGMIVWGGKYSAPLLAGLLEGSDPAQQKVILGALNQFDDRTAAVPVAKVLALGNGNMYAASEYLAKIGPDAEEAVLGYVQPSTYELTKETVILLGKIGTRKSMPAFSLLQKTVFYPRLKQEVADAKKAILARQRQQKTLTP